MEKTRCRQKRNKWHVKILRTLNRGEYWSVSSTTALSKSSSSWRKTLEQARKMKRTTCLTWTKFTAKFSLASTMEYHNQHPSVYCRGIWIVLSQTKTSMITFCFWVTSDRVHLSIGSHSQWRNSATNEHGLRLTRNWLSATVQWSTTRRQVKAVWMMRACLLRVDLVRMPHSITQEKVSKWSAFLRRANYPSKSIRVG